MRVVDIIHDCFCGDSADSFDGHYPLDLLVAFSNLVEPFFNHLEMALESFQLSQFKMQLASPKFFDAAVSQRFAVFLQKLASAVPGLGADADGDALVGKDRADAVLAAIDATDKVLAIDAHATTLANFFERHMRRLQFINRSHSSQLDRVIFIGLAFDVLEQPSIFVGTAGDKLHAVFTAQVADPTARTAGLKHYQFPVCDVQTNCGSNRVESQRSPSSLFSCLFRKDTFGPSPRRWNRRTLLRLLLPTSIVVAVLPQNHPAFEQARLAGTG